LFECIGHGFASPRFCNSKNVVAGLSRFLLPVLIGKTRFS